MSENNILDTGTQFIKRSLDTLLLAHPVRTTTGALVGISINIIISLFSPLLNKLSWLDFSAIEQWKFVILGIVLLHIPTIKMLFQQKPDFPEEVEKAFIAIKRAKSEGLPSAQINPLYRSLCEKVLVNMAINEMPSDKNDPQAKA